MADRQLRVQIIADPSQFTKGIRSAEKGVKSFSVSLGSIAKSAALVGGATAAVGGVTAAVRAGISEFSDASKVAAQTAAAIKSTGGVANVTAKQVDKLASSVLAYSGIDDEAIKSGENLLLTFKNIRNEIGKGNAVFDRATKAAVDLSVAGFGSIDTTAKQLGKALNDPVRGMAALSRAGVTFSDSQKKVIRDLVETGRTLDAQKLILKEVESQVGGSAKALGDTLPGQISKAKESLKNLAGDAVAKVAPTFTEALKSVNAFGEKLSAAQGFSAKFDVVVEGVENVGRQVFNKIRASLRKVDFAQLVATVENGLVRGLRGIAKVLDAIDWSAVGRAISRGLKSGIQGAAAFLQSVDWGIVGRRIVKGIVDFLSAVDWVALIKGVIKLVVAALKGAAELLVGAGKELGKAVLQGVGAGLEALGRALEAQAIRIALKVLHALDFKIFGRSIIPGIDGLVKRLEGRLGDLSKTATETAKTVTRAAGSINRSAAVPGSSSTARQAPAQAAAGRAAASVVKPAVDESTKAVTTVATHTAKAIKTVGDTAVAVAKAAGRVNRSAAVDRAIVAAKPAGTVNRSAAIDRPIGAPASLPDVGFRKVGFDQFIAGIQGLSASMVKQLRSRFLQLGPGGTMPSKGFGAFGMAFPAAFPTRVAAAAGSGQPLQVNLNVDGRTVASVTEPHITVIQQKNRGRRAASRTGVTPGI